jgi:DNA-binding GntR family transcriptional regulator
MPVPVELGKHKRSLLRENAYVSIRDAIVDGTLAPGERLRDSELEQWLGVSRTPIRDAIARLEQAGLVHTQPGRSTIVSTIERKAVLDAQAVAASMHSLAVRSAVPLMRKHDITRMQQANKEFAAAFGRGDVDVAVASDDAFHNVAVEVSQNHVVVSVLDQVTPTLRRLERLRFASLVGRDSIAQHERIIELCRDGDVDGAALAVQQNWESLSLLVDHEDFAVGDKPRT